MSQTAEAAGLRPDTHVLIDALNDIHPSPLEAGALETTPLLGDDSPRPSRKAKPRKWWQRRRTPHAAWCVPAAGRAGRLAAWLRLDEALADDLVLTTVMIPTGVAAFLLGASVSVEVEILAQVACRMVMPEGMPIVPPPTTMPIPRQPSPPTSSAPRGDVQFFVQQALDGQSFVEQALVPHSYRHILGFRIAEPANEDWAARCRRSPDVQKKTAAFMTKLMMLGGLLSAATTGYWGALSDSRGRILCLQLANFGQLGTALGSILLVTYPEYLGEKWAMLGVALSGLLGGDLASQIVTQAYLSDIVGGSRAQVFSINEAIQYVGVGAGPVLGGLAYRWTGLLLIPHYAIVVLRGVFLLLLLLVVPESLSKELQYESRRKIKVQASESGIVLRQEEDDWRREGKNLKLQHALRILKKPLQLFAPLAVVLPRKLNEDTPGDDMPLLAPKRSKAGRDWSLTLVACSFAFYMIIPGITPVKVVYARGRWDWGPPETGAWITFSSGCKVLALLGILPLVNRVFRKAPPSPSQPWPTEDEPGQILWDKEAARLKLQHDSTHDLKLAQWGILITLLAYLLMALPNQSLQRFLFTTFLVSLSSAVTPALQSLALSFSSPKDSGKVLAALSVLCNLAVQLVGPPIFGAVYIWSVTWWPELVFGLAAAYIVCAFLPTLAVRLKDDEVDDEGH